MRFLVQFWRAFQCNFCRKCKLAAISLRFQCDICCNFPQIVAKVHQVSNMFETSAISRRQIAQKSPLVYTYNFCRELERDKNCTKKRMCKRAFIQQLREISSSQTNCPQHRDKISFPDDKLKGHYHISACARIET